ncbi:tetratricopeptide repeat protein [Reichenbachiella versicolor]|uniref:tetratricopeptide repeat protein n=1 Tax=Reichenbachiella versicolor TaxID=1821036 RepID=UPI000D6E48F4|nr:tetratricopeptide repeat protein [Reichenbachiella versicolor]
MKKNLIHFLLLISVVACSTKKETVSIEKIKPVSYKRLSEQKFIGKEKCKTCHEDQFKEWKGSHHDQAMKIASDSTVLGNFNNTEFDIKGANYKFFRKGKDFMVNAQNGDNQYQDFKVKYTFGVYPLQQYLIEFQGGKYQTLQACWDSEKGRWMDVQPHFDITHDEWLHWTRGAMNWNSMCADCHSTNLHKNYNPSTQTYNTTFSEINVSCEACHGPGEEHVKFYEDSTKGTPPKLYLVKNVDSRELVDKCARCHARRGQITPYFDYEGHFSDHYDPALLTTDNYFPDGQIEDEDYVWASFRQSKMFHEGVSCKDCHNMHSLKLKDHTNGLCLQCHDVDKFNTEKHHFHPVESESGKCINCHMTGRVYMGNDFRRDHSFRIPRPDQSVIYNTPNACTECHEDKSNEWASKAIENFYGDKRPAHFSDLLLPGQAGNKEKLYQLIDSAEAPEIVRATAIQYLATIADQFDFQRAKKYFNDKSSLIRTHMLRNFHQPNDTWYQSYLNELLNDPNRLVRTAAAKNKLLIDPQADASGQLAYKDNWNMMMAQAEFASGQHALAAYYETKGDIEAAKRSYEQALEIDNFYNQARLNLALLNYRQGNIEEAKSLYEKVISQEPDFGYTYYMMGLLLNETGETTEALNNLKIAFQKETNNYRIAYNYALLLHQNKHYSEAIKVVEEASLKFGLVEDLTYVKLIALMESGQTVKARKVCQQLLQINPSQQGYQQIMEQLISQ